MDVHFKPSHLLNKSSVGVLQLWLYLAADLRFEIVSPLLIPIEFHQLPLTLHHGLIHLLCNETLTLLPLSQLRANAPTCPFYSSSSPKSHPKIHLNSHAKGVSHNAQLPNRLTPLNHLLHSRNPHLPRRHPRRNLRSLHLPPERGHGVFPSQGEFELV